MLAYFCLAPFPRGLGPRFGSSQRNGYTNHRVVRRPCQLQDYRLIALCLAKSLSYSFPRSAGRERNIPVSCFEGIFVFHWNTCERKKWIKLRLNFRKERVSVESEWVNFRWCEISPCWFQLLRLAMKLMTALVGRQESLMYFFIYSRMSFADKSKQTQFATIHRLVPRWLLSLLSPYFQWISVQHLNMKAAPFQYWFLQQLNAAISRNLNYIITRDFIDIYQVLWTVMLIMSSLLDYCMKCTVTDVNFRGSDFNSCSAGVILNKGLCILDPYSTSYNTRRLLQEIMASVTLKSSFKSPIPQSMVWGLLWCCRSETLILCCVSMVELERFKIVVEICLKV